MSATGRTSRRGMNSKGTSHRGRNPVSTNVASFLNHEIINANKQMLINIPIEKYKDLIHARKGCIIIYGDYVYHYFLNLTTNILTVKIYNNLTDMESNVKPIITYNDKVTHVSIKYGEPIAGGKHKKITKNMKSVKRGKKKGKKREKQTKKR